MILLQDPREEVIGVSSVIEKLDVLRRVGAEELVDQALTKLIQMEIERTSSEQERLKRILSDFERRYGISSEEAYRKFESGELGDNADLFEWTGIYEIYRTNENHLKMLKGKL
jgi:hypothetical protein